MTTLTFTPGPLRDALARLRDLAGADWLSFICRRGTVWFMRPDTTAAPTHRLVAGRSAVRVKLTESEIGRRKRVLVLWANGIAIAEAADIDLAHPRELMVSATHITEEATALQLAEATLAARDRVSYRGECTVPDGAYDIESIRIGDTVQLLVEQPAPDGALATYGAAVYGSARYGALTYAGRPLIVVGLAYDYTSVRLELSETQPRAVDEAARLSRQVADLARRQAAAHLVRDAAGALSTTDALTIAGNSTLAAVLKHEGSKAGFFNTTPTTKPNVTGDWTGATAAAGKALTEAIAALGLLTDNTTV